jgi:hypothetical protein
MIRSLGLAALLALGAVSAAAQQPHQHGQHQHGAEHAQHDGARPAGWLVRPDRDQPADGVRLMAMDGHFHVVTGPAAVLHHPDWVKEGDYRVAARFTQTKAPQHPESYGIVVGGRELQGAGQRYAYLLVRGTGEYFIATRRGDERVRLVDWTAHPAIARQDAQGRATNTLAVEAKGAEVHFYVNDQLVARRPRAEVDPDGVFGFRINHHLDVVIEEVVR